MNRKRYIDIAKFIAVLFVMIDHAQYNGILVDGKYMFLRVWWIAFFLPVFFICAGVTNKYLEDEPFHRFVIKKVKGILVPYVIWCFILRNSMIMDINLFKNILIGTIESLSASGINSVVWFLPSFFMASCIVNLVIRMTKALEVKAHISNKIIYGLWILLLSGLDRILNSVAYEYLYFGLKSAFHGAALMIIGILLKDMLNMIYEQKLLLKLLSLTVCGVIGTIFAYINMPVVWNGDTVYYEYAIWMAQGQIGKNILLFYCAVVPLSFFVIIVSMCLEKISFLAYLGERSLLFMTIHNITHALLGMYVVPHLNQLYSSGVVVCIFVILSVVMIIMLLPIVDCFFPFLYKSGKSVKVN